MTIHGDLAAGRWRSLSLAEQMGNIGSEVERACRARQAGNPERFERAFARAVELFDLTGFDPRWRGARLREIRRAREEFCRLMLEEVDESAVAGFQRYFLSLALVARRAGASERGIVQGQISSSSPR